MYDKSVDRLKNYPSTDYIGYYSVTKEETYEFLAVYADEYLLDGFDATIDNPYKKKK